jgi:hypothetical protein
MLAGELIERIGSQLPELSGRLQTAADLAELVRQGAWPQASPAGFVLPLGLTPRSAGDASAGAFTQMIAESWGVLLVVRASGDITGGRAEPAIDALVRAIIGAVCGWGPDDAMGVFALARGQILAARDGRVTYQLDFSIPDQVRVIP